MASVPYESVPVKESGEKLLDLGQFDFVLDTQYFTQGLSSDPRMFLRESVIEKLLKIQKELHVYKFKIWDGFRPREVQRKLYDRFFNELKRQHSDWSDAELHREVSVYVSNPYNPKRIPSHTTGGAVDLTLVTTDGSELDMGTEFDHFGSEAASFYFEKNNLSKHIVENRKILRETIIAEDFYSYEAEWWHFDFGTQLWAFRLAKPYAIYGEMETP